MHFAGFLACLGLFWVVAGGGTGALGASWDRPDFATSTLLLDRGDGTLLTYRVELATTPRQHAYGLMHVEAMDADAGMLFIFDGMAVRSFWMKNTLIPLDMIFIEASGRVAHIARETEPLSEELVPSRAVVRFVLEVPGGTAAQLGIVPGDVVQSDLIGSAGQPG